MARMIPPQFDQSTVSAAEKRIFHLLESDPDTSHWFVLHSLGLSKRRKGPYGEIDFVVLVPSGSVACLEIEGGRVSCKNGVWEILMVHESARQAIANSLMRKLNEGWKT
jgi:hypothetical protein